MAGVNKYIMLVVSIALILVGIRGFTLYSYIFSPLVDRDGVILITADDDVEDIKTKLVQDSLISNTDAFDWVVSKKKFETKIKCGNYAIKKGATANQLVNGFIAGNQTPVDITFNNIRTVEQLTAILSTQLQVDSMALRAVFSEEGAPERLGFTKETYIAMFIPNTYEVYWTVSAEDLLHRFKKEYSKFWSGARAEKAKAMGFSYNDVTTLASILQMETNNVAEMPTVAGVYVNRVKRGWPLQADPTVKFALGDFAKKRVLLADLEVDSPYNTYKNAGLPPGPIYMPDISTVDAVLNYEKHKYMYFCAKEDFSGVHVFSRTLSEHNRRAAAYHRALNRAKIR